MSARLTPTQLEVLQLSANGLSIDDIARLTFRAPSTVKQHRQAILRTLGVSNIAGAVAEGFRRGLLL